MGLYIVTGPPCAGKTTWVHTRARPGDIVVDLDAIASALTVATDDHTYPRHVRDVAYRARAAAINEALKHTATADIYVIHTLPSTDALTRYEEHQARIITVDPGKSVVMARIHEQRPASMAAVAERWYASRSDTVQPARRSSRSW